jgi:UDP:flavonoid glycosyltransferase YjiC (YdhE family)
MRLLFCAVSAYGHVLPLAPLMAAALRQGHTVALTASAGLAEVVVTELPEGVVHLPAGPMPIELATEAARRSGENVMAPSVDGIGETFGGVLLDLAADAALDAARGWCPDIVVSEVYCTVGPLLAATLDVPWYQVRMTAPMPTVLAQAIERAEVVRYRQRDLRPVPATGVIDLWPAPLRDPALSPPDQRPVLPVRAQPHRRSDPSGSWTAHRDSSRARVLVTLGTIFSDSDALASVVDAVAEQPVDVVATLGLALQGQDFSGEDGHGRGGGTVRFVPFVPIDELLDGVDVVVGVGGAGTVLAALSRGIPLVLWPRGADHPVIAAGVAAAGAGVVVDSLDAISSALARVRSSDEIRTHARRVATAMARAAGPDEVVRVIAAPR